MNDFKVESEKLFAILQKYDFSSKSQLDNELRQVARCCLRYCKSTIFQANHNAIHDVSYSEKLFAILQKYDFSSKSQPISFESIIFLLKKFGGWK